MFAPSALRVFLGLGLATCLVAAAPAQTVTLFEERFETCTPGSTPGWQLSGLFNVQDLNEPCSAYAYPFPSGMRSMWFGHETTCSILPGSPGSLSMTRAVLLPDVSSIRLSFGTRSTAVDDGIHDLRQTSISADGGATWSELGLVFSSPWYEQAYDLTPWAGRAVRLRFTFVPGADAPQVGSGWFIDDVRITARNDVVGASFCHGDGTAARCPCINWGDSGRGCSTLSNAAGALLEASGIASVANDTLMLRATGSTSQAVTFLQGTLQDQGGYGSPLGDGLMCISGSLVRLRSVPVVLGMAQVPTLGEPSVALLGGLPLGGGTRTYQAIFRSNLGFCMPASFNMTNGLIVSWGS